MSHQPRDWQGTNLRYVHISKEFAGFRLDRALAILCPDFSRERLKSLISAGHVKKILVACGDAGLDSTDAGLLCRDPAKKLCGDEHYVLSLPIPQASANPAQAIPLDIVFEDDHLLVVNKPAGLVVHPACGHLQDTLVNALLYHCQGRLSGIGGVARPGIVHRIDKDTSGLLVVAKTDLAHQKLSEQFAKHSIKRNYIAFVRDVPKQCHGTIDTYLGRSPYDRKKMAIISLPKQANPLAPVCTRAKKAITHWQVLKPLKNYASVIECRLETGRTHQIRVHMASIGHGLLGDPVYGGASKDKRLKAILHQHCFQRQALHACFLGFIHPISHDLLGFSSDLPYDMLALQDALLS